MHGQLHHLLWVNIWNAFKLDLLLYHHPLSIALHCHLSFLLFYKSLGFNAKSRFDNKWEMVKFSIFVFLRWIRAEKLHLGHVALSWSLTSVNINNANVRSVGVVRSHFSARAQCCVTLCSTQPSIQGAVSWSSSQSY